MAEAFNSKSQDMAMNIIANAGDARSKAFEALKEARKGNYKKANELLDNSKDSIAKAHDAQTQMLIDEANGKKEEFSILTVHAQDHFMTSMLANELISEMVIMYEKFSSN